MYISQNTTPYFSIWNKNKILTRQMISYVSNNNINNNVNNNMKICLLFHVFNIDIFYDMIDRYIDFFKYPYLYIYITTNQGIKKKYIHDKLINNSIINFDINIITNKGCDIGGLLNNLKNLKNKNYQLYNFDTHEYK